MQPCLCSRLPGTKIVQHDRGQTRDVTVYRLVGAGSIEELIYTRRAARHTQEELLLTDLPTHRNL